MTPAALPSAGAAAAAAVSVCVHILHCPRKPRWPPPPLLSMAAYKSACCSSGSSRGQRYLLFWPAAPLMRVFFFLLLLFAKVWTRHLIVAPDKSGKGPTTKNMSSQDDGQVDLSKTTAAAAVAKSGFGTQALRTTVRPNYPNQCCISARPALRTESVEVITEVIANNYRTHSLENVACWFARSVG